MANFNTALQNTLVYEGGYSDNSNDLGGITFKGISRKYNPQWTGWVIIDAKNFNSPELNNLVESFYKTNYWNKVSGDQVVDQTVANFLFDTAVNAGVIKAGMLLQRGLNTLNTLNKDILVVDGIIGPATIKMLNSTDSKFILRLLLILRGYLYVEICQKNPLQKSFIKGWLNRLFSSFS